MSVTVYLNQGEGVESALRRLKKICEKSGLFQELKNREYYVSRSERAHAKKLEVRKKIARNKILQKEENESADKLNGY